MADPISLTAAVFAVGTLGTSLALSLPNFRRLDKNSGPLGIHQLDKQPKNPVADICFVHGLSGDWKSTWLFPGSESGKEFWWPEYIQKRTNSRVLLYGYHTIAPTAEYLARRTLYHHAQSLVDSLAKERAEHPRRPLIFVAHSLGGLLVMSALILSSQAREKDSQVWNISLATTGMVFLGTPPTRPISSFSSLLKKIAENSGVKRKILKGLERESEILQSYLDAFEPLRNDITINSFFEPQGTTSAHVLAPLSAVSQSLGLELDSNHANVAKFRGPNDANYEKVENAIRELCKIRRSRRDRKWAQIAGSHSRETAHRTLNFRIPSQLPSKSTHFTGRESELEWMEQTLLRTCLPNCPSNCHTINLYGIAGIGKTQIALEFAYRFRDDFSSIFWIPSHTQIAVENAFLDIAHTLRLTDSTTKDENSTREIPQLVMEWLMNGRNSNWLLIFDDADFAAAPNLKPLIPTTTCVHGNAIITSRSPIKLPFTKPYHVEGLELEEARAFFKTGLGLPSTDDSELDSLSDFLGRNPFALSMACEFMRNTHLSPRQYLDTYEYTGTGPLTKSVSKTMENIFAASIKSISSPPAQILLSMCCMLSFPEIPLWIFEEGSSKRSLRKSLSELESSGLIAQQPARSCIMIHRMARRYGRQIIPENTQLEASRELCETASNVVVTFKKNKLRRLVFDKRDANFERELVELAHDALGIIMLHRPSSATWDLDLQELGKVCDTNGKHDDASRFYELHIMIKGATASTSQEHIRLGIARRQTEEFLDSDTSSEVSGLEVQFHEALKTADDDATLQELKSLNRGQGNPEKELEILRKIIEKQEKYLGPMHRSTLDSIQELSQRLVDQGFFYQAVSPLRRLYISYGQILSPDHPSVARVLDMLTSVSISLGKLGDAETFCKEAISIHEKCLGTEHLSTLKGWAQLASIYHLQGRYLEAQKLFVDAIGGLVRMLGPPHPDVLRIQRDYAQTLITLGKTQNARELRDQGLDILVNVLEHMEAHLDVHHMNTRRKVASLLCREIEGDMTIQEGDSLWERAKSLEDKYVLESNGGMNLLR